MTRKLKAGSLLLVVGIATIIAACMLAMLLLVSYTQRLQTQRQMEDRLQRNGQSALAIALLEREGMPDSIRMDLYEEGHDSIYIVNRPFGLYRYIQVAAFDHQNQWQRTALIGKELTEKEKYTLWLANEDRPLSVSGDTWIQGTVFLPPA